jgi:hypothetical protein
LVATKERVKAEAVDALRDDHEFEASITQGAGDPRRVYKRFSTVEEIIRHCLEEIS